MEGIQFRGEFFLRWSSDNAVERRFQISIETCGTYSTVQYLNACESRMLHTNTILLLLGRAGPRNTLRRRSGGTGKCGAVNSGGAASLAVAKMTETHVNPGVCCQMRKHRNPIRCYALFTHLSVPGSMGHSGLLKPLLWNYLCYLATRSRIWGKEQKELAHLRQAQVSRRFRNAYRAILGLSHRICMICCIVLPRRQNTFLQVGSLLRTL